MLRFPIEMPVVEYGRRMEEADHEQHPNRFLEELAANLVLLTSYSSRRIDLT